MAKVASMDMALDTKGLGISSDIVHYRKGETIKEEHLETAGSLAVEALDLVKDEASDGALGAMQKELTQALEVNEKLKSTLEDSEKKSAKLQGDLDDALKKLDIALQELDTALLEIKKMEEKNEKSKKEDSETPKENSETPKEEVPTKKKKTIKKKIKK